MQAFSERFSACKYFNDTLLCIVVGQSIFHPGTMLLQVFSVFCSQGVDPRETFEGHAVKLVYDQQ